MGNKSSNKLEYNDFLQLAKDKEKQQIISQQHLLQQFQCTILKHNNKAIEGICMNEVCKQQNRRTCFDCMIDKIHDKDHGKSAIIKNADQCEDIIQEFKIILNNQIDDILFQFYYEQLEFCDETNDHLAYIKYKELNKIYEQIKLTQQLIEELNFKKYLSEQQKNNIGLFQYLKSQQKQIIYITQLINECEVEQPKKFIQYFQVGQNALEDIQAIRKKKKQIIQLITNTFKNNKLTNNQKQYLFKNIEENIKDIHKLTDNSKQDLLINNYKILVKLGYLDSLNDAFNARKLLQNEQYKIAIIVYDQLIEFIQQRQNINLNKDQHLNVFNNMNKLTQFMIKQKLQKKNITIIKVKHLNKQKNMNKLFQCMIKPYNLNHPIGTIGLRVELLKKCKNTIKLSQRMNKPFNLIHSGLILILIKEKHLKNYKNMNKLFLCMIQPQKLIQRMIGALEKLQKYDQAILVYDKLIQINSKNLNYYFDKGLALKKLQKYDQAILMYDKAIQINSKRDYLYISKGQALEKLQKYDQAILVYDQAIQLDPKNKYNYKYKGQALEKIQKYEQAILVYDKAIQIDPYYKDCYFYKGQALDKVQKFDQCILIYEKLIKLDPKNAEYYYYKGQALEKIQKYEQAILMYDQAIQLDPQEKYIQSRESTIMNQVKS